jgi:hypothetical protein
MARLIVLDHGRIVPATATTTLCEIARRHGDRRFLASASDVGAERPML